jgi:MFS family permease
LPTLPGSSSTIAWIGSLYSFTTFFACFITGPIFDRGYLRTLLLTGTFLLVFAFMMISLADRLYQFILAQGVCAGLGSGILFSTSAPILVQWWARHLGLANGIVASGAAVAGIIYPIAFHKLLPAVGFPWAVRILGFIALFTLLPANIFLKRRIPPGKPRAWLDHSLWTDWPFTAYMCAALLAVIGLYSMLFFLASFVKQQHLLSEDMSFYILPILNAGSLFGRIIPNMLADYWGALNVAPIAAVICSLLTFCMIAVHTGAGVIVMAVIFGFFSAVFVALPGLCCAMLIRNKTLMGTRTGMSLAFAGLGALAGGPGGGSVLSYGNGHDWNALWVYGGLAYLAAGLCYVIVRHLHLKEMKKDREKEEREHSKEDVELEEKKQEEEPSPAGILVTPSG